MIIDEETRAALMRVHLANMEHYRQDPNGESPACKPALGTTVCERCGLDVNRPGRDRGKACQAVPPEQRWTTEPR